MDDDGKGQSLVEMAIITPILIIFLMGILEVGVALRNYLVLINASREVTRFAVRPEYIKPYVEDYNEVGYDTIVQKVLDTIGEQVFMNFEDGSAIVVNVIAVDTGYPCNPDERAEPIEGDLWPNCDCEMVATNPYTPYLILNRNINKNYGFSLPISHTSWYDINKLSNEIASNNDVFNCKAMKTATGSTVPRHIEVVMVELFYEHHQAFGFPFISNPYTDPIILHATTVMRKSPQRQSPFEGGAFK